MRVSIELLVSAHSFFYDFSFFGELLLTDLNLTLILAMIYLHRSFFAQAMLDYPTNPFLSPFAPSFLTAFRCASIIIKASAHLFERSADMALRVWFLMYHTFSAAVSVLTPFF